MKRARHMHIVKVIAIVAGFGFLCFMSSWSFFNTSEIQVSRHNQLEKNAFNAYKMQNTLGFLNQYAPDIDLTTDAGKKQLELLVNQYLEADLPEELILLYEAFPAAFDYKELSSLAIANAFLDTKQTDRYRKIREDWRGHEREPEQWFFMDVEALIIDQNPQEAFTLLNSHSLKGEAETDRLIRLALLCFVEDPKQSWKYLSEASLKDPKNPSISTCKAHLLESVSQYDLALCEYIYAIQKDPENPLHREHLADFYFRTRQYGAALKLLKDSLAPPSSDVLWLKALFLSRIIAPIKYDWDNSQAPQGELMPLVNNIKELPPGIFWNYSTFDRLPLAEYLLNNQQETFWLRLLMALKSNREADALNILQQNPFQTISWMPELEAHLRILLTYRTAYQQASDVNEASHADKQISYLKSMDKDAYLDTLTTISKIPLEDILSIDIPKGIHDLMLSKEAFASLFLAIGWDEAALQLHVLPVIPSELPEWVPFQLVEAIRRNRGNAQALQFAQNQKATPGILQLISHLTLKEASEAKALQARKAFEDKDWKRAKEITEALIKQFPDNLILKENLHNILLEEKKKV